MGAPQYIMVILILWGAVTELLRMALKDKTERDRIASLLAVILRYFIVTVVLAWGGFWVSG